VVVNDQIENVSVLRARIQFMSSSRPQRSARLGERLRRTRQRALRAAESGSRLEDLVVITGVSGAGKSTAMAVFEDAGYFCVDNLPPAMIESLAELFMHEGSMVEYAAVVCDVRGGSYFEHFDKVLETLEDHGIQHRVIFLDADEETLLNRFKETRRRHPLAPEGSVAEGIAAERGLLAPLRDRADLVVDTAGLSVDGLRRKLAEELLTAERPGRLAVTFTSFGHKHGPLRDADLCFDVRFLPNPHYDPELRPLTGLDPKVVEYIGKDGRLDQFYEHLVPLLDYLLPQYVLEGKAHLTVGIGCTGGRHRSVAIAERLADHFGGGDYAIALTHRDVDRPSRG
jgi:UPF0042 nucleotide-binding protein